MEFWNHFDRLLPIDKRQIYTSFDFFTLLEEFVPNLFPYILTRKSLQRERKKKNWLYIKYTEAIFCGGSTGISIMYIWMTRHENRYQAHVILKNGSWKRTPNAKECMYINSFRSILPSLINWIDEIFMTRIILLELFIFIIRLFLSRKKLEEN